jgi:hypothetical protein
VPEFLYDDLYNDKGHLMALLMALAIEVGKHFRREFENIFSVKDANNILTNVARSHF